MCSSRKRMGPAIKLSFELIPQNPDVRLEMTSLGWRKEAGNKPGK